MFIPSLDKQVILFEGDAHAKIIFISSVPSWEGTPLSEAAKDFVLSNTARCGIKNQDIAFAVLLDRVPPGRHAERVDHSSWNACTEQLLARLGQTSANILCPLDKHTLQALTNHSNIDDWQLSIIPATKLGDRKVIPLYHPERVFSDYSLYPFFQLGCQRIAEEVHSPLIRVKSRTFHIDPSFNQANKFLTECIFADQLTVDVETAYGQITCVGLGMNSTEAICIPTLPNNWSKDELFALWTGINDALNGRAKKIFQNFIYDASYFSRYGITVRNLWHDTMHANKFLHPELPMGLDTIARIYTRQPYWKDDGKNWKQVGDLRQFWIYNCTDVVVTAEAAADQRKDLHERGLEAAFDKLVMQLAGPAAEMCWRGLPVSLEKRELLKVSVATELTSLTGELDTEVTPVLGKPINPRSPAQVKTLLKQKGYRIPIKRGKETSDATALMKLLLKYPQDKSLKLLLKLSEKNKLMSGYLKPEPYPDGRFRFSLNIHGTDTGRWCAARQTQVMCPGQTVSIESIKVGDLVYCFDKDKNLRVRKVLNWWCTGKKDLMRVHWYSQQGRKGYVDVTPDHRVMLMSGEYVEARNLKPKQSLRSLGRYKDSGYWKLAYCDKKKREHRVIVDELLGELKADEVVHHINHDPHDNRPENLKIMQRNEHCSTHAKQEKRRPPKQPTDTQRARGSRIGTAKLTEDTVLALRELGATGVKQAELARRFKISTSSVNNIVHGRSWRHLNPFNHYVSHVEAIEADLTYDIEVDGEPNFIANEICIHNSCSQDAWDNGFNVQTISPELKKMFEAPPGWLWFEVDLRQADSRFVAWDAPEPTLMKFYNENLDIHRFVAARPELFNKPLEQVTKDERQLGKKVGHASNYGMRGTRLAEICLLEMGIDLSPHRADQMLEGYHRVFPGIRMWQQRIQSEIRRTKRLSTPLGRERIFYDRLGDDLYRVAYAYRPQSTVSDVINSLIRHLDEHRDPEQLHFAIQAHDAAVMLVRESYLDEAKRLVFDEQSWNPKLSLSGGLLQIPVEAKAGPIWGEATEVHQ